MLRGGATLPSRGHLPKGETTPTCVLLADRHHGLTEGLRSLLETAFGTVMMVADTASLLEGAVRRPPDLAIVDLSLAREGALGWLEAPGGAAPT